ncbi:MAG: response regulator transcription factor [Treponema sp.]
MKAKPLIFITEDIPEIASLMAMYLNKDGKDTKVFETAEDTLTALENGIEPDLFIVDLNLPGMSGFDFLQKIRTEYKPTTPAIVVSARDADEDIIKGLGLGADEFVTKPFSPKVLVARVEANLRRVAVSSAAAEASVRFGDYILLLDSNVLKKGTLKIQLSIKEYSILEHLVLNAGKTLTPEKIYQDIWKSNFGDLTAVAVYIQRLRKKIEDDPSNPQFIKTQFGKGYIFSKECIASQK